MGEQPIARVASADNYSLEAFRTEVQELDGDIGILTAATGPYLTAPRKSQLTGSVAAPALLSRSSSAARS